MVALCRPTAGEEDVERVERYEARQRAAGSPQIIARRGCGGFCGAVRRIRRAGLSVPLGNSEYRFFGISNLQNLVRRRAAHGCATKTEIVLECRRGLPRAASRRHRSW